MCASLNGVNENIVSGNGYNTPSMPMPRRRLSMLESDSGIGFGRNSGNIPSIADHIVAAAKEGKIGITTFSKEQAIEMLRKQRLDEATFNRAMQEINKIQSAPAVQQQPAPTTSAAVQHSQNPTTSAATTHPSVAASQAQPPIAPAATQVQPEVNTAQPSFSGQTIEPTIAQTEAIDKFQKKYGEIRFSPDENNPKILIAKYTMDKVQKTVQVLPDGTTIERIKDANMDNSFKSALKGNKGGFVTGLIGGLEVAAGYAVAAGGILSSPLSFGTTGVAGTVAGSAMIADGGRRLYNANTQNQIYTALITKLNGYQEKIEYNNQADLEGKISVLTNPASSFTN